MEAFKTSIQQDKDNTKELSRIGINIAKAFEQTSNENIRRDNSTNIAQIEMQNDAEIYALAFFQDSWR